MGSITATAAICIFTCGPQEVRLSSDRKSQRRSADFPSLNAYSVKLVGRQGYQGITRRGWTVFGAFMAENIFSGRYVWGGEQKENAVEEKSQVDNDKVNQGGDSGTLAKAMDNETESPLSGLLSIFDPNEKTKSGKLVPKGYLKSARNVVKTLKESLKEESSKESDVRRSADQAKEAIRDYLSNWKGQKAVESEVYYILDAIPLL